MLGNCGKRIVMNSRFARTISGAAGALLLLALLQASGQGIKVPPDILTGKNPVPSSDAVLAKGKDAFAKNCAQCHGMSGKGDGPMSGMLKEPPADLTDPGIVGPLTDGEIFWSITKGRPPIMPSFESKLSNQDRWALVDFLRDLSKTKPNTRPSKAR